MGKQANEFEEFMALEKIKQQKLELQSHMRLYGRAGLYDSWVAFQAKARKERQQALKEKQQKAEEFKEVLLWIAIFIGFTGVAILGFFIWYKTRI